MTRLPFTGGEIEGNADAVARALFIDRRMAGEQEAWIRDLRARGVKAAHPDDGWVDRERNTIHLCYPQFNDGVEIGDLLALGYPWGSTRLVRVVGYSRNCFAITPDRDRWYLHFEAAE